MVGPGPTIHEFPDATSHRTSKLVVGRAKHAHGGMESKCAWLSGKTARMDALMREKPAAIVSRETRKSVTV
jgi:hypothetical protein